MNIREDIASELKLVIPQGKWFAVLEEYNKDGKLDFNTLFIMVVVLAQHVELLESKTEELLKQLNPKQVTP